MKLREKDGQVQLLELGQQARINLGVAQEWLMERIKGQSSGGIDRLLLLSHCIRVLEDLSAGDGAFTAALTMFEDWQRKVTLVKAQRKQSTNGACTFIPKLDDKWLVLVKSIATDVKACVTTLDTLFTLQRNSALGAVIEAHLTLAKQITQQISLWREIEDLISREEQDWLASTITSAMADFETHRGTTLTGHGRKGLWEVR
jgi:hypothetical protein